MDIGDWITLSAVIVALGLGVASILHTKSLQNRERKERILNEIIEWAIKYTIRPKRDFIKEINDTKDVKGVLSSYKDVIFRMANDLMRLAGKNKYTSNVALIFNDCLQKYIESTIFALDAYVKYLDEWRESIGEPLTDNKNLDEMKNCNIEKSRIVDDKMEELMQYAFKVIEQAVKIKTNYIK